MANESPTLNPALGDVRGAPDTPSWHLGRSGQPRTLQARAHGLRHRAPSRSAFPSAGLSLKPTSSRGMWGWRLGRDGHSLCFNSSNRCSTCGLTCQRCPKQSSPCWPDILSISSHGRSVGGRQVQQGQCRPAKAAVSRKAQEQAFSRGWSHSVIVWGFQVFRFPGHTQDQFKKKNKDL